MIHTCLSFLLILAPCVLLTTFTSETEQIVEDAIIQALDTLEQADANRTAPPKPTQQIISSQKANEESKRAQFTGEVLEEATKILVSKYGISILEPANAVIDSWNTEGSTRAKRATSFMTRMKRYTPSNGACNPPPRSCNDPIHIFTRSITGYCNNRQDPTLGNSVTPVRRLLGATSYSDGLQAIRTKSVTGADLPSTRAISNALHDDTGANSRRFSHTNHLHMQIGQFLAHDIIFMPSAAARDGSNLDCSDCTSPFRVSPQCAPIPVPANDRYFKTACIRLTRALNGQQGFGVRTQIDQNSHFIDLSSVYGSSDCEARTVRSFVNGKLLTFTGRGYVLPPQNKNDSNCQSSDPLHCFTCGDFRNSLNPGLIPIHSIFIKEHNRLAEIVKGRKPSFTDEQVFQLVRKILIGMWQHIIYNEYLPKYLPRRTMRNFDILPMTSGSYAKYDPKQNPSLSIEFAAAAFRFGHSQARQDMSRLNERNESMGTFDLGHNIFYADQQYGGGGWEPILRGMMRSPGMTADRYFSFPMRNQLFETRGKNGSGVDLVAVNIMRGRDVGLLPYVQYREFVGLPPVRSWTDMESTFNRANLAALQTVYADPADVDLYTGIMMENLLAGGQLGPTASFIVAEQFKALKVGDRFFYESATPNTNNFSQAEIDEIRKVTLAKLLCTNADVTAQVSRESFNPNGPVVPCSSLPQLDMNVFLK